MAGNLSQAEERAYHLLLQHLTHKQQDTFHEQGYFEFVDRLHRAWRCYTSESLAARSCSSTQGRLVQYYAHETYQGHKTISGFNIWAVTRRDGLGAAVPECDTLLALKVAVEANNQSPGGCGASYFKIALDKKLSPGVLTKYS